LDKPLINIKSIIEKAQKGFRILIYGFGLVFLLLLIISFTSLPYWGIYHLGISGAKNNFKPDYLVIMGGSGMPSQTALIRTYHAAQFLKSQPNIPVIIALPDDVSTESSHLKKMENELRIRGVESSVSFENKGTNTRAQALLIKELLNGNTDAKLLIVSSPEHIYRTVKCFKKIGFGKVAALPAFEKDLEPSLMFNSKALGGKGYILDVGESNQLRYQFWNHLKYEITLIREYSAILYYKLQGWI